LIGASLADEAIEATVARFSQGLPEAAGPLVAALREAVLAAMAALDAAVPQWSVQMPYRQRPLLEQWEARGPGLMRLFSQWLGPSTLSSVDVVLVYPVLGGGGDIHPLSRSVRLEAVLTNNVPQLPEVVRLSWLLARLEASQTIEDQPAGQIGLALAALQAAEQVELATCDQRTWLKTIESWHIQAQLSGEQTLQVWKWWQQWCSPRGCGMAALDELQSRLNPSPPSDLRATSAPPR
jgi:hypothetical protein